MPVRIEVGGPRSRRTPLLIVVVAAALLVGGLVLGNDDRGSGLPREARDDRLRDDLKPARGAASGTAPAASTSTSSTTTTVHTGPVLPEQTGAALLLSDTSTRWTWLDLDTGLLREVRVRAGDPYAVYPVRGGIVALHGETAEFQPLPQGDLVRLGRANQLLSSGSPDTIWLVRTAFDGPSLEGSEAVLVDLRGNERSGIVQLPASYPIGATERGLVFSRGGRTYLAEESGIRPLALGEALGSNGSSVVVLACDDEAVCAPEVVDVATGRAVRLPPIPNPFEMGVSVLLSDTGDRLAIVTYYGSGQSLAVYDLNGRVIAAIDDFTVQNLPRWLPDDLGLVATVAGSGVARISIAEGGVVVEPISALGGQLSDFVYVIPR
jgi:hypothetical protein